MEPQDITFSLTALIDEWIADRAKEKKEYATWRASSLGKCPREHFYHRLDITPTTPPNEYSHRKFAAGDIFHEWVQGIIDKQGYATDIEKELVDKELDLAGRCDLIVTTDEGKRILYDIKTMHSQAFWHLEKSGGSVKNKYPQYWKQLGAYMMMLRNSGEPVDQGRIILISKDDCVTKEVTYYLNEELEEAVTRELDLLNLHWKNKTLPDCICNTLYIDKRSGKSSGPKYCSYGDVNNPDQCCSSELFNNHKEK